MTDAHLHLGEAYLGMEDRKLAELQFRDTVALSPLNVAGRNRLGELLFETGRVAEAAGHFQRSVESEPNAEGYDGLGDISLKRGDSGGATRSYLQAVAVDPFDHHAHFKLGEIYARAGRAADAVREYEVGFVTDPHNAEARAAVRKFGLRVADATPVPRLR